MTPLRRALGRVPPGIILIAGAVGFLVPAIALVTAAGGLALSGAALPGSSSCSLWDCVGQALNNLLSIPGSFFGGSAVTVVTAITVGGIGGGTYGDGLGSGGNMGTEGVRSPGGDPDMERDSPVYDDHGREIPGTRVPGGTNVTPLRTIYAPNGNPMYHRVVFNGKLPPGLPRTGWVEAKDTRAMGTLNAGAMFAGRG